MCMIVDISDENPNISLDDIHKFCEYLDTAELYDEGKCRDYFDEIDSNNDGFISLPQFFTFVSKTNELFMPICDFRLSLINHFFPHDMAMNILMRRAYIHTIREYKIMHNGALPDLSCKDQIYGVLFSVPNKYQFDYDPNENISIFDITRMMIMRYKKDIFLLSDHKPLCTKKNIPKVISVPKIQEYDRVYTVIACNGKQCGGDESRNNSRTSMMSLQNGLSKRPHSILKPTGSYHQLHPAKSMKSVKETCSYTAFDFNSNNKVKKNLRTYKSANQSQEHISPKSPVTFLELPGFIAQ